MRSLPLFHRIAGRPVIVLGEGDAAEAKRRLVERAGGVVVGEDNLEARLAFVALAEPDEAAARLSARGLLVNATDRPDLCDFTVPSILERDPVLVAVGTSGASAGLAKQLRLRLEILLPQSLGALAAKLEAMRDAIRARWPDAGERRRALDEALVSGGALDLLSQDSPDLVEKWIEYGQNRTSQHQIQLLMYDATPAELPPEWVQALGTAELILYDPDVPAWILNRARADAPRHVMPYDGERPPGLTVEIVTPKDGSFKNWP